MGLSSCFILLGSSLLYVNTGVTYFEGIYILFSLSDRISLESLLFYPVIEETAGISYNIYPSQSFDIALIILSVGYLFKVSSAPFHYWSPVNWFRKSYFTGNKLSISEDSLKLLIPTSIRKGWKGWINNSFFPKKGKKVTSQKINENKMGYCGSKSEIFSVKEQRVNDSFSKSNFLGLRCILMGFERNYQIKILSPLRGSLYGDLNKFYKSNFKLRGSSPHLVGQAPPRRGD